MSILLAILSGVLLSLAFPKFGLSFLAWVALVPFFLTLDSKHKYWSALAFGITFFGINLYWVNTLFRFGGWWIFLAWGLLAFYEAIFILLFVKVYSLFSYRPKNKQLATAEIHSILPGKVSHSKNNEGSLKVWLLPILWVLFEIVRSFGVFGFTAGTIGYSQARFTTLIQISSFFTVYGVSFLVVLFNAGLAELIKTKKYTWLVIAGLLVIISCVYGNSQLSGPKLETKSKIKFALIQPNLDQKDKMNNTLIENSFALYEKLSQQATFESPEVIVWPETAIFAYLAQDPRYSNRIKELAKSSKAWFVIGTAYSENSKIYNSIVTMSPQGNIMSRYDKQHLMPFGEFLPFRALLFSVLKSVGSYDSQYSVNSVSSPLLIKHRSVVGSICFESTFPFLIKSMVKPQTSFILNLTNDAWFLDSAALYQHLEQEIFRAVENRRYFIQASNNGISVLIDPYGRIVAQLPANQSGILSFEVPLP